MTRRVEISQLGARGDGVAHTPDGQVFVPFALPGEVFTDSGNGEFALDSETTSPDRIEPACPHFGTCGGCAMQHVAPDAYLRWKSRKVADALAQHGIETPVEPIIACEPGTRRRAVFSARQTADGPLVGFMRHRANVIEPVAVCPLLEPAISGRLAMLRDLTGVIGATSKPFHVAVTATETGLDLTITEVPSPSGRLLRELTAFAIANGLSRLSVGSEIAVSPRDPVVRFDGIGVVPPPGAFLQAVGSAEQAMADLVTTHLARAKRIVDLFSGCGTFALRLAKNVSVHAVEAEQGALDALGRGFRFAIGLRTVTTERRDLYRRPVTARDLSAYDGLVFDPPRAGAELQAVQIARSGIPLVAAVSCNPATLARDMRILTDGGYRIVRVVPVDQFLWSPHVEAVALLTRPKRRLRRPG